jgi:hypothetical protein
MTEIIDRLTPLLVASASRESPRAARSSRTRSAMRDGRVEFVASVIVDSISTMLDCRQVDTATVSAATSPAPTLPLTVASSRADPSLKMPSVASEMRDRLLALPE